MLTKSFVNEAIQFTYNIVSTHRKLIVFANLMLFVVVIIMIGIWNIVEDNIVVIILSGLFIIILSILFEIGMIKFLLRLCSGEKEITFSFSDCYFDREIFLKYFGTEILNYFVIFGVMYIIFFIFYFPLYLEYFGLNLYDNFIDVLYFSLFFVLTGVILPIIIIVTLGSILTFNLKYIAIGLLFFTMPTILIIKFSLAKYFVVDQKLGPLEALKKSFIMTNKLEFDLFRLFLRNFFYFFPYREIIALSFVYHKLLNQHEVAN